jgi:hypothetical protein
MKIVILKIISMDVTFPPTPPLGRERGAEFSDAWHFITSESPHFRTNKGI